MTTESSQACTLAGSTAYCNLKTGEVIEMNVYSKPTSDNNFHKMWAGPWIEILLNSSDKKLRVLAYLFKSKNSENIVIASQREIAKACGISIQTTSKSIAMLKSLDCVRILRDSVYQVNPSLVFKGSSNSRTEALSVYQKPYKKTNKPKKPQKKYILVAN